MTKKTERQFERDLSGKAIGSLCQQLEWAVTNHEMGKSYSLLRELGVYISYDWLKDVGQVKPDDCREHFQRISGATAVPTVDVSSELIQRPVCAPLGDSPTFEEFLNTIKGMRISAAGKDEVPIDMIRQARVEEQRAVYDLICGRRRT